MQPSESHQAFERFLVARGYDLPSLSVPAGIVAMLDWHRDVRADGCNLASDGDMLLYQWGTHDWGRGNYFELDITRQFLVVDGEDDRISQLSLTFSFAHSSTLHALHTGTRWCHALDEINNLRTFILSSPAYALTSSMAIVQVDLDYEDV